MKLILDLLKERYVVCKLACYEDAPPPPVTGDQLFVLARTRDEISLVCSEEIQPKCSKLETGWRAFMVRGPLEFSMVGIVANLTEALAKANISVFVISTFDTDFLMVKEDALMEAKQALSTVARVI